jgi:putative ABC transport system substrate-binding protein
MAMCRSTRGAVRLALTICLVAGGTFGCRGDAPPPPSGPWRVTVLEPVDPAPPFDLAGAVRAGAHTAGLADETWTVLSRPAAGLADQIGATPSSGVDAVVAISAAGLTAALASGRPTVFTGVVDPAAAGARAAGRLTRWLPWLFPPSAAPVTGVTAATDFETMLELAAPLLTRARVGAVEASSDADSVALAARLHGAAGRAGIEAVFETARAPSDAAAAVARLCGARIGALVALGDRTTDAALGALADGARVCGVPLLGTRRPHAAAGALLTLARDERGAAREAGRRLVQLLRDPRRLPPPFAERAGARLVLNAAAAEQLAVGLPLGLVERADEMLGEEQP